MFPDIGLSEILLVALVVLLVAKPEDVPEVMRKAGIFMAHIRHFTSGIWRGWQGYFEGTAPETPTPKLAKSKRHGNA